MATNKQYRRVDLDAIPSDFSLHFHPDKNISLKSKQQGFRFFSEGYFSSVQVYIIDENIISVRAKCYRSQRKNEKPHNVNFDICDKEIIYSYCSCQAGMGGSCSHVIGLVTAISQWLLMGYSSIPEEVPCTSLPQTWHAPRGTKLEPEPVSRLRFINPKLIRKRAPVQNKVVDCRKIRVTEDDVAFLKSIETCAISYLLSSPQITVKTHLWEVPVGSALATQAKFYIEDVLQSVTTQCGPLQFPKQPVVELSNTSLPQTMTYEECHRLEEATREQAECALLAEERKNRLTASQFGLIAKRQKVSEKFVKMITEPKQFTSKATAYGRNNEKNALTEYCKKTGNHVHKCGLIVNPKFQFLGASPDAKVCIGNRKSGIIEIKCPYNVQQKTIKEACTMQTFCLKNEDGNIQLKKQHNYYYQVQGQLLVSGADFCDFVVYTKKDMHIERILMNTDFCKQLLLNLSNFYEQYCKNL